MDKKPKHFLVLKIVGFACLCVAICGIVFIVKGFNDFESNNFLIGAMMFPFALVATFTCLMLGFSPEMAKLNAKSAKYIQEENKKDLTDIATNSAEIISDAVSITTKSVVKEVEKTAVCKNCGVALEEGSVFCNKCGEKQ